MHSALVQELVDLRRRDTEVSVPALRRHRLRGSAPVEPPIATETAASDAIAGEWVDPGDTMAASSAIDLILREAVVRRNHRIERAEPSPLPKGCVDIDWARSTDPALSLRRIGKGVVRIEGSSSSARVSFGIDGLAFTVRGGDPQVIAARLSKHYRVEIVEESPSSRLLVLAAPRSHT